ncbi:MAG TPA: glycosyltransferase [Acidimicrobiales bacterium]|nr:glycosyltransferase [Acidimicrobiales bacterium]
MTTTPMGRVRVDGQAFMCGDAAFRFRGVTYGTFEPDVDGELYPDRHTVKLDFAAMSEHGFTVARTYTVPPERVLAAAADTGLRVLAGLFWEDWRYMVGTSVRQRRAIRRQARDIARRAAVELAGNEQVLGISVGNEIPADVVRWLGGSVVSDTIESLTDAVRDVDPALLVTYANYPTTEYLQLDCLDFVSFNVFLDREADLRRYLTRLQHVSAGRPLVLSEIGVHAPQSAEGEAAQAETLDWQLETATERGVAGTCVFSWTDDWWVGGKPVDGWRFGLTHRDRSPKPALDVAARWNDRTVADIDFPWPSVSVVVCAYNAEATLQECLSHLRRLDYPDLEVVVVDDGSTDRTADIARSHGGVRLVALPHAGLSVARNEGFRAARGELVAYLDSDAYPSPEWPYFLALGMDGPHVGAVGGPNLPPAADPVGAHRVANAPGGPAHVLVSDDRAEHIPGCNMAIWRSVLFELGGFDPVYTTAGDDIDICWRLADKGWQIGFHPAAFVWHHPRPRTRAYLRQQLAYGKSEAVVESRHPDRFTATGSARWRGHIYGSRTRDTGRQRIYRGPYGSASYQSVYRTGGHAITLAHQLGVPTATALLATAPLAAVAWYGALPAGIGLLALLAFLIADHTRVRPPTWLRRGRVVFRLHVASLHLLQPVVRLQGRLKAAEHAHGSIPPDGPLPSPVSRASGGTLVFPADGMRDRFVATLIGRADLGNGRLRAAGGWADHDASLKGSVLVSGKLISSDHPVGWVQLRVRRSVRRPPLAALVLGAAILAAIQPPAAVALCVLGFIDAARGYWRSGALIRRLTKGYQG